MEAYVIVHQPHIKEEEEEVHKNSRRLRPLNPSEYVTNFNNSQVFFLKKAGT